MLETILAAGLVMAFSTAATADPKKGEALFKTKLCLTCHVVGGAGGKVGPDLTNIGTHSHDGKQMTREDLMTWIRDPKAKKPDTKMPKPRLTDQELNDLVDYLQTLK